MYVGMRVCVDYIKNLIKIKKLVMFFAECFIKFVKFLSDGFYNKILFESFYLEDVEYL